MNNNKTKFNKSQGKKKKKIDLVDKCGMKKSGSRKVAKYIEDHVSSKMVGKIYECGDILNMLANGNLDKKKLINGLFCKNRFCPLCAMRKAAKETFKITLMMQYVEDVHKKAFVSLTLTAPNVKANKLSDEITKFNSAFKNLNKRKEVLPVNKGYLRKLEITYDKEPLITHDMYYGNFEKKMEPRCDYYDKRGLKVGDKNPNYDTYHTHFHVLMAVNRSYFTDRTYINQKKWLGMWRDVMGDPTITQVFVKRLKTDNIQGGSSAGEIAKYACKPGEYTVNKDVFDVFYAALKGRQLLTYNGLFNDVHKLYKKFEKKKGKEREEDPFFKYIKQDETEYIYMLLYQWCKDKYKEVKKRELTDEEYNEMNPHLALELEVD